MTKSILLAVLTLVSIHAQVSGQTSPASKQLVVNGRSVKAKVLELDGKHFVAVEDLAQSLGGTLGYSDEQITLTFSQPSLPNSSEQESGRVKGTLTYFFNSNYGNRPDTGSEVWLIEGHIDDIPDNEEFSSDGNRLIVSTRSSPKFLSAERKIEIAKHTVADGSGNFDLLNIPTGQYTLILQSKHAKGRAHRDILGRVRLRDVQVKAGETLDASMDFGVSE